MCCFRKILGRHLTDLGVVASRLRGFVHNSPIPATADIIAKVSLSRVPSEVAASGHHGFVKWGHDAKITKTGVIPTRGSPGLGKANGSRDRRQDLGLISECTTWN